jgi:hypothetical protein
VRQVTRESNFRKGLPHILSLPLPLHSSSCSNVLTNDSKSTRLSRVRCEIIHSLIFVFVGIKGKLVHLRTVNKSQYFF